MYNEPHKMSQQKKIELILLTLDKDNEIKEVTYPMETLEKAGLDGFISGFSLTDFRLEKIDYNSENRGLKLEYFGEKLKIVTKKEHSAYYKKLIG